MQGLGTRLRYASRGSNLGKTGQTIQSYYQAILGRAGFLEAARWANLADRRDIPLAQSGDDFVVRPEVQILIPVANSQVPPPHLLDRSKRPGKAGSIRTAIFHGQLGDSEFATSINLCARRDASDAPDLGTGPYSLTLYPGGGVGGNHAYYWSATVAGAHIGEMARISGQPPNPDTMSSVTGEARASQNAVPTSAPSRPKIGRHGARSPPKPAARLYEQSINVVPASKRRATRQG
jgi:hypothetical protein